MNIHDFLQNATKARSCLRQRDLRQVLRDRVKRKVSVFRFNPLVAEQALAVEKARLLLREIDAGRLIDFATAPITHDAVSVATEMAESGLLNLPLPVCSILLTRTGESYPNLLLLETGEVLGCCYFTVFEATNELDNQAEFVGLKLTNHVRISYLANGNFIASSRSDTAACQDTVALAHIVLTLLADERSNIVRRSSSSSISARKTKHGKLRLPDFWKIDHTVSAARLTHETADEAAKHMMRGTSFFEAF